MRQVDLNGVVFAVARQFTFKTGNKLEEEKVIGTDIPIINTAEFHGEMGWREKEESLEHFRHHQQVLVSTEAGGEGRNLQFARIVINYDLPWNPMRLEQRIGRVHRLGQEHPVRVVNLVSRGTLEAYVLEILDRKIRMFELIRSGLEQCDVPRQLLVPEPGSV